MVQTKDDLTAEMKVGLMETKLAGEKVSLKESHMAGLKVAVMDKWKVEWLVEMMVLK
jgi:hypothetical protein